MWVAHGINLGNICKLHRATGAAARAEHRQGPALPAILVTREAGKAGKSDPVLLKDQIPLNARNRPALLGFECILKSH